MIGRPVRLLALPGVLGTEYFQDGASPGHQVCDAAGRPILGHDPIKRLWGPLPGLYEAFQVETLLTATATAGLLAGPRQKAVEFLEEVRQR